MRHGRLLRRTLLFVGLFAGFVALDSAGVVAAAGADVWNLPALQEQLEADAKLRVKLETKDTEVFHRMAVKDLLLDDLVAGRRTVADVADEFLRLHTEMPEITDYLCAAHQCTNEREATARNVLDYAGVSRGGPNAAAPYAPRLQAEFRAAFGHPAK